MAFASGLAVRKLSTSAHRLAIKHVTVIGGGLMGSGIAQVAAQTGHNVTMVDMSEDILQKSKNSVHKSLSRVVKKKYADDAAAGEKFLTETMNRFSTNTDAVKAAENTDLVIEAIVENIGIKQKLFKSLDEAAPECAPSSSPSSTSSSPSSGHYLAMARLTATHRALLHHGNWARALGPSHQALRTFSSSQSSDKDGNSSSSSSDSDSSDSDSDGEQLKTKSDSESPSKQAQSSDLISKLKNQEGSKPDAVEVLKDDKGLKDAKPKKDLNLAKPGKLKKQLKDRRIKDQEDKKNLEHDKEMELEPGMTTAIKDVAKEVGGKGTASELLSKLKEQQGLSESQSQAKGMDLNDLFGGITVKKSRGEKRRQRGRDQTEGERRTSPVDRETRREGEQGERAPRDEAREDRRRSPAEKLPSLFGEQRLGVFDSTDAKEVATKPSLFDVVQKEELEKYTRLPPTNAFEEQIEWKKKEMVWDFPVNNEVGMEHEQNVGFHEHVFLEHLLQDGFPNKGPVRHFMELVCVGLSKNPYLSVQQKHDHINWFRDYFKSKQRIMEEMMITEDSSASSGQKQIE